ncbi:MAG: hypothetical protein AAF429_06640 [Pseudomonadota bacterium]
MQAYIGIIRSFGYLCSVLLVCLGLYFVIAPDTALMGTSHQIDKLPLVLGGRYFFFGAMLAGAIYLSDSRVTAFLLAGFAFMGFFDAVVYLGADPIPHLSVGNLSLIAAIYFYSLIKKETT